ncbi:uncharacterized protein PGTG_05876 [Puccinia graminis f. sp. tritici CRL 75-36-700-3]|uniref:Uncharacterized protein n=1 Tax=Puccinia graminis f. sp. tritici (strain CRL 75-36-700-3 / race SCCL) TaxID=418459 RepID=E3K5Y4_PUCGT|nr:uncharacterized protein PGTG_05876 [Puccinia graminis f. sp. tritici CRL 75-36-700-3]EFP79555.1 hypothetical protein PGTG_05876 [Puccinia graminis f. sp. tritici CRL 75-36-700-3]
MADTVVRLIPPLLGGLGVAGGGGGAAGDGAVVGLEQVGWESSVWSKSAGSRWRRRRSRRGLGVAGGGGGAAGDGAVVGLEQVGWESLEEEEEPPATEPSSVWSKLAGSGWRRRRMEHIDQTILAVDKLLAHHDAAIHQEVVIQNGSVDCGMKRVEQADPVAEFEEKVLKRTVASLVILLEEERGPMVVVEEEEEDGLRNTFKISARRLALLDSSSISRIKKARRQIEGERATLRGDVESCGGGGK